jgi:DNA-binding CsgD family transcriptional regulator/PAS domain-containing protein
MIEQRLLSDLISAIYDCAIEPAHWPQTLDRLRVAMNGHNAQLALNELPSTRTILSASVGIDEVWLARQPAYSHDIYAIYRDTLADMTRSLDEPTLGTRQPGYAGSPYLTEWCAPQGLFDVIAFILLRDSSRIGSLGFGRHVDQGPVTDEDFELARLLAPHLRRSVVISDMLNAATLAARQYEDALDRLNAGVLLVTSDGAILYANAVASRMFGSAGPLLNDRKQLAFRDARGGRSLAAAVNRSGDETTIGKTGLSVPLVDAAGGNYVASVLPLKARHDDGFRRFGAAAAIFISTGGATRSAPVDSIAALFDLTPAEARVLAAVAGGQSTQLAATSLGVSENTIKVHLGHIFAKTGATRQAELIHLATSLTPPIGA